MKKNSIATAGTRNVAEVNKRANSKRSTSEPLTIGVDLGDRTSHYCILNAAGEIVERDKVPTRAPDLMRKFHRKGQVRMVLEVGTHSPWVSRCLARLGHEVIVANTRKLELITGARRKNDRIDAEKLARLGRVDPKLLSPITHRGEQAQEDLAHIRCRHDLVGMRTAAINAARGLVKSSGYRLAACDADYAGPALAAEIPKGPQSVVEPLLRTAEELTKKIKEADQRIHAIAARYPQIKLVTAISSVGELTALTFLLTLDDVSRFAKSRDVGAYLGLVPGERQSGGSDPQQRITKEGDRMVRWLLVQCAHTMLRHGGPDSDLRRWGLAKLEQEQQKAGKGNRKSPTKKKILVAVARKLAVLMHHLYATGEVYDPLYGAKQEAAAKAKRAGRAA